jgi:hypothetical protein
MFSEILPLPNTLASSNNRKSNPWKMKRSGNPILEEAVFQLGPEGWAHGR